jgi:hypothetical protein
MRASPATQWVCRELPGRPSRQVDARPAGPVVLAQCSTRLPPAFLDRLRVAAPQLGLRQGEITASDLDSFLAEGGLTTEGGRQPGRATDFYTDSVPPILAEPLDHAFPEFGLAARRARPGRHQRAAHAHASRGAHRARCPRGVSFSERTADCAAVAGESGGAAHPLPPARARARAPRRRRRLPGATRGEAARLLAHAGARARLPRADREEHLSRRSRHADVSGPDCAPALTGRSGRVARTAPRWTRPSPCTEVAIVYATVARAHA